MIYFYSFVRVLIFFYCLGLLNMFDTCPNLSSGEPDCTIYASLERLVPFAHHTLYTQKTRSERMERTPRTDPINAEGAKSQGT